VSLLESITGPADIKRLSREQLQPLADEVRRRLIDVVSQTGGHIGAGLGVVELTVALGYCFDSPRDKIVWDVGHQGYPWKILTGRNDRLPTLRQAGGLSGFLRRTESPHDQFGAGHAGTGLSRPTASPRPAIWWGSSSRWSRSWGTAPSPADSLTKR